MKLNYLNFKCHEILCIFVHYGGKKSFLLTVDNNCYNIVLTIIHWIHCFGTLIQSEDSHDRVLIQLEDSHDCVFNK